MGTPEPVVPVLQRLVQNHEVVLVLTQPPRPRGRHRTLTKSPVHQEAERLEAAVAALQTLRPDEPETEMLKDQITGLAPEVMVTAAYGLFLPKWIRESSPHGALNIHPSLLPRHRGASPVAGAILAGDPETGVSLFRIEKEMDAGPLLGSRSIPLTGHERTGDLTEHLFELGTDLLLEKLAEMEEGKKVPLAPQDENEANYAPKIQKNEGEIDWTEPAAMIERRIRAYDPWPACRTKMNEIVLTVWDARVVDQSGEPGRILRVSDEGILVAAGRNALLLIELQRSGKRRMPAGELLKGLPLEPGMRFELLSGKEGGA